MARLVDLLAAAAQHWGHLPAPCPGPEGSQAAVGSVSTVQHVGSCDRRVQQCKYRKCRDDLIEMSTVGLIAIPCRAGNEILK